MSAALTRNESCVLKNAPTEAILAEALRRCAREPRFARYAITHLTGVDTVPYNQNLAETCIRIIAQATGVPGNVIHGSPRLMGPARDARYLTLWLMRQAGMTNIAAAAACGLRNASSTSMACKWVEERCQANPENQSICRALLRKLDHQKP